jgi:hypothetical protein
MINLDNNWKAKTLETLENDIWGEPEYQSTLVVDCHRLRKVPLDQFAPSDLRRMIGQGIGLDYLVPLAIDELEKDILLEAYYYPGDLLEYVKSVSIDFWKDNLEYKLKVNELIKANKERLSEESISTDLIK